MGYVLLIVWRGLDIFIVVMCLNNIITRTKQRVGNSLMVLIVVAGWTAKMIRLAANKFIISLLSFD